MTTAAAELQAKAAALLVEMNTNNESYLAHAACLPQPKSLTDLWAPSREALLLDLFTECKPQQQQPQQQPQRAPRSS
tara:strand:- start:1229 stop:1459 length:231 start_codon:yes stop_codon:yes gene_type:complete